MKTSSRLVLRPVPSAAGEARTFVRRLCDEGCSTTDLRDVAVLLTSETVTNAVIHGRSEIRLDVFVSATQVRVEVGDDNTRCPIMLVDDPEAISGRGVGILDALSTRWSVEQDDVGKIVWFELGDPN
jgi:anti-sigma regulatory factor (Ser/Thr protein kinase)